MASFAQTMVAKLEALLAANPGAQSVSVDGNSISFGDLLAQYNYWKKIAARQSGSRPVSAQVDLSRG